MLMQIKSLLAQDIMLTIN